MKSRKSLGKFDTDWLVNARYKLWFAKEKNDNCKIFKGNRSFKDGC